MYTLQKNAIFNATAQILDNKRVFLRRVTKLVRFFSTPYQPSEVSYDFDFLFNKYLKGLGKS